MSYRTSSQTQLSAPAYIRKDLDGLLKSFTPASSATQGAKITNVQVVASYSWTEATTPTISVPSSPNIWTNVNPRTVPQDSGLVVIDQNAYRMERTGSPLAPIFAAIDALGEYDFAGIDLVSDRNNLRKLLRWSIDASDSENFRIDVDLAGNTCLFTRREEQNAERIVGFKGFGREYEKAATRPPRGCPTATSHHRIISTNMGDLKILLRFEVDACTGITDAGELASAMAGLGINSSAASAGVAGNTRSAIPGVTVTKTNPRTPVAQSSLIEIKTRASHRSLDWADTYPQLYLSQTPYLYLAKHTRGSFSPVEIFRLTDTTMARHAKLAEKGMAKLKAVLDEILVAVRGVGSGVGLSLICIEGRLALYKRKIGTGKAIGCEISSRFI